MISPLQRGFTSLVTDGPGQARIGVWGDGLPAPGEAVYSVRQNGDVAAKAGGLAAGGGDGRREVAAVRQGVGDDAGAGPDHAGIFAGDRGSHAPVGGRARQALVIELEQQPGRHMRHVG